MSALAMYLTLTILSASHPRLMPLSSLIKKKNAPVHDAKGGCIKVKKGEVGLLIGKITRRSPFDGYTDPEKNKYVILKMCFKSGRCLLQYWGLRP